MASEFEKLHMTTSRSERTAKAEDVNASAEAAEAFAAEHHPTEETKASKISSGTARAGAIAAGAGTMLTKLFGKSNLGRTAGSGEKKKDSVPKGTADDGDMADEDVQKLTRLQLLEILVEQRKEIEQLKERVAELTGRLARDDELIKKFIDR